MIEMMNSRRGVSLEGSTNMTCQSVWSVPWRRRRQKGDSAWDIIPERQIATEEQTQKVRDKYRDGRTKTEIPRQIRTQIQRQG